MRTRYTTALCAAIAMVAGIQPATAAATPAEGEIVRTEIAQEQLGHASIATTLNIYTHAVDASHRKAIEASERELFVVFGPQWTTDGDMTRKHTARK